jgi:ribosomal protein S18 acetylase RimI-like enzyme
MRSDEALKLLERFGFEVEKDLRVYAVKLSRYSKYARVLKNSVPMI